MGNVYNALIYFYLHRSNDHVLVSPLFPSLSLLWSRGRKLVENGEVLWGRRESVRWQGLPR